MADSIDVLGKAKDHFRSQFDAEASKIEVPEWGFDVYYKPLNLKQQDRIFKYINSGSLEALAETLIVRALDVNGNKIFKPVNKTELMTMVDADVISRICSEMGGEKITEDDALKNSE